MTIILQALTSIHLLAAEVTSLRGQGRPAGIQAAGIATLANRLSSSEGSPGTASAAPWSTNGFTLKGTRTRTPAWKAVRCMGRYAENPEADPVTGGGGGGGGEIPGEGGGGDRRCEYELEWDCWEENGETVCGNFRWLRTDEWCEWVKAEA